MRAVSPSAKLLTIFPPKNPRDCISLRAGSPPLRVPDPAVIPTCCVFPESPPGANARAFHEAVARGGTREEIRDRVLRIVADPPEISGSRRSTPPPGAHRDIALARMALGTARARRGPPAPARGDPGREGDGRSLERLAGSFVPFSSALRTARKATDTATPDPVGVWQAVQDVIAPTRVIQERTNPIDREIAGNEALISGVGARGILNTVAIGAHALSGVYARTSNGPEGRRAGFVRSWISRSHRLTAVRRRRGLQRHRPAACRPAPLPRSCGRCGP